MSRVRLASLWIAAFALLLLVGPAFAQPAINASPSTPTIPKPPEPREEPIYIVADGYATSQFKSVVVPASLYLAGKLQYRPWLPIIPSKNGQPSKLGWIKIEVLTVKLGDRQFNFTGYGTLAGNRIALAGWSLDARVFVQGTIASNSTVRLQGTLLVQPRTRPSPSVFPPGNFWKTEVWQLKLQGFISVQPPIQPLK
jgi:hypothetical protein